MQSVNDIYLNCDVVGTAEATKEGLYYVIRCVFHPAKQGIFRVKMHGAVGEIDLGVGIPSDNGFEVRKKLPVKRITEEDYRFTVYSANEDTEYDYIPLKPNHAFPGIQRLRNGKFRVRDGEPGIIFPVQVLPGNDLSR